MNLIQVLETFDGCSALGIYDIPDKIAYIISIIYTLLLIGVPLLLILFGMLDLGKAVIASKEDEIKKGQKTFISRLIAAIIVFFVLAVVRLVVSIAAGDEKVSSNGQSVAKNISTCIDGLINYNRDHRKASNDASGE